ncbi:hypothetical protein Cantr_01196 [Candida viswanathii]|uniref:Uncharacterized protein n=1 Tax=Candida viswanathii TaxID=5486 RepID=A0A367YI09_9ASCO|nr:hypothetical protein Cantr_01196 [Candida viswanathii]
MFKSFTSKTSKCLSNSNESQTQPQPQPPPQQNNSSAKPRVPPSPVYHAFTFNETADDVLPVIGVQYSKTSSKPIYEGANGIIFKGTDASHSKALVLKRVKQKKDQLLQNTKGRCCVSTTT